jgi:hypothetical protein
MSCEHLICAQCAGPVSEGRCPACRAARSHVHHGGHGFTVPYALALLLLLIALMIALQHIAH